MLFKESSRSSSCRSNRNINSYLPFETRRLLAVTSNFDSGELTITLDDAGDSAVLAEMVGEVTVNGSVVDGDPGIAGIQSLAVDDVSSLNFVGLAAGTMVSLDGNFDTGNLASIAVSDINQVTLIGSYVTSELNGNLIGDGGSFAGAGSLVATGAVDLSSSDDVNIFLNHGANWFGGTVSIITEGDVNLVDATGDFVLGNVDVQNLNVTSQGQITDSSDSSITVGETSNFMAESVDLGNDGGFVNLNRLIANTEYGFSLDEFDGITLNGSSTVGSAEISSGGLLNMGIAANITVEGSAVFDVGRLLLGVGESNTFNAGQINFRTLQDAIVSEDSELNLFGDNTAIAIDLFATGDITNAADAMINIDRIASFESPGNVNVGNSANDTFHAGSIQFDALDVNISEDSDSLLVGQSRALNLVLESDGFILDGPNTIVLVNQSATFGGLIPNSTSAVILGDTENDFFAAGRISFNARFLSITENDSIQLDSGNANNIVLNSPNLSIFSAPSATITVANNATLLAGNAIFMSGDVQFGRVTVNAPFNVTIDQVGRVQLSDRSFVGGNFTVISDVNIVDTETSNLNVGGTATFVAPFGITIGDQAGPAMPGEPGNAFLAGTLRFDSFGDVDITENSNIVLIGENNANSLRLTTTGNLNDVGTITNAPGVTINIADANAPGIGSDNSVGNLFLTAFGDIDLGSNPDDLVNFDNLNFQTLADIAISAFFEDEEDEIFIFGRNSNSNVADEFRLTTNVDVFDGTNAEIVVDTFFRIEARNVVLGNSESDCLLIPEDSEFVTTSGNDADVNIDEAC